MFSQRLIELPPQANPWGFGLASGELLARGDVEHLATLDWPTWPPTDPNGESEPPFPAPVATWCQVVEQANRQYFRFELDGLLQPGEPCRLGVSGGDSIRSFGLGLDPDHTTRKLVAMLILDVDGTLQLGVDGADNAVDVTAGMFLAFPAYVDATCRGDGHFECLVGHAVGPAFR